MASRTTEFNNTNVVTQVTIADGQTTSSIFQSAGTNLIGIEFPSNMTAATVTFENSKIKDVDTPDDFKPYYDVLGNQIQVTVTTDAFVGISAQDFFPTNRVRIVGNIAQTGSDAVINIISKPV